MTQSIVDLRSDTVTHPTPSMKKAMMEAELGDDVLGDDPTVAALEEKVANLLGKESALFVPSGTMANQVSIRCHTEAGDEVISETSSHIFLHETGALAGICGVQVHLVEGKRGLLSVDQISGAIRGVDTHFPPSKLLVLENTHNHGGGTVYPLSLIEPIRKLCQDRGLMMHMDGARLWNACVASDISPAKYSRFFDSVSVCLSKGLGAPVGSVIAGAETWIGRARRFRKMFGGGMRQSGILAAAGIYALDHHYERLKDDHENAKQFAKSLAQIPGILVSPEEVETNMVFFGMEGRSPHWVEEELRKRGVWVFAERACEVRAVFHMDLSREGIEKAVESVIELTKDA